MVEFCDNCEGLLLPVKIDGEGVLKCNICGKIKPLNKKMAASYQVDDEINQST